MFGVYVNDLLGVEGVRQSARGCPGPRREETHALPCHGGPVELGGVGRCEGRRDLFSEA